MNNKVNKVQFWFDNPNVLVNSTEFWPTNDMTSVEKYNAITRTIILLTIIGFVSSKSVQLLFVTFVALGIIVYLNNMNEKKTNSKLDLTEGYATNDLYNVLKPNLDTPTKQNPLSNVMLEADVEKKAAPPAYNNKVKKEIDETIKQNIIDQNADNKDIEKLFYELGDKVKFTDSTRSFYSTANTQIPNDQEGFSQFCYGDLAKK